MTVRIAFIALAAALSAGAASAQDAPIARNSIDTPPPVAAVTTPTTAKSAQSTAQALASVQPAAPVGASTGATGPVPSSGDPTSDQIADWLHADSSPVQPLDPHDQPIADPDMPRQIHGEVGFTVSNRGYGGYAATSMPIGQASELDVAVSAAHLRTPWGNANPKSLSIGLFLDASDISRFISRDKCHVPRYGVSLPGDPQVQADGSCLRADKTPQGE